MKNLLSLLALTAALTFGAPQKSEAAGACVFYWTPVMDFFMSGGSVVVQHSGGGGYMVNAGNVYPTSQYSLAANDVVFIFPTSCAAQAWGYTVFGACNTTGGITYQSPIGNSVSAVNWIELSVHMTCACPTGSSGGGLSFVKASYCQAGGGGGQ